MISRRELVTAQHQQLRAYIYVRQSSLKQVQHHQESQRNQYALVERATALGWAPERVHVIDRDLGLSGQDGQRPGFRELVTEVSLGHVGLVLAYEVSRLARNNADWYALLDLAALRGTLLADIDGLYDPRTPNDRLLLGLRGMLSEAELHLLQVRMAAGRQRQIERASYRQHLPTGLVRLADGRVVKDPDRVVQRTIALVLAWFAELGSCQKVLRRLRDAAVQLPRRQTAGAEAGVVLWKPPSEGAIYAILHNPAYAAAFVYGRRQRRPDSRPGQHAPRRHCGPDDWVTAHQGIYPAYLSWEEFMRNQARLTDNANQYHEQRRGAIRDGPALLTGLLVCGRCGRQLHVEYKTHHHYVCSALGKEYGAPICLYVGGGGIDAAVVTTFFSALQPAELALLDEVLAAQHVEQGRLAQQYADRVARAEYEARLAQRQYAAVDPDNRLVAAELEHRWELALRALAEAQVAAEQLAAQPQAPTLDPELRQQLSDLGPQLPALWSSGRLSSAHQKALLRSLIRRVILTRPRPDAVDLVIVWISGASTRVTARTTAYQTRELERYPDLVTRIGALAAAGHPDRMIAEQLTQEGFHSARQDGIPPSLVTRLRRSHHHPSVATQFRGQDQIAEAWTVWGLSRALQVDRNWLYARIRDGTIPAERHPVLGYYLIPDSPTVLQALRDRLTAHRSS